jgi:hypothetical protein
MDIDWAKIPGLLAQSSSEIASRCAFLFIQDFIWRTLSLLFSATLHKYQSQKAYLVRAGSKGASRRVVGKMAKLCIPQRKCQCRNICRHLIRCVASRLKRSVSSF